MTSSGVDNPNFTDRLENLLPDSSCALVFFLVVLVSILFFLFYLGLFKNGAVVSILLGLLWNIPFDSINLSYPLAWT